MNTTQELVHDDLLLQQNYQQGIDAPFIDNLTGLYNHGFFQISLERELKRSQRYGTPLALALVDVDSFSAYNQRFGPVQADRVLKEVGRLIKENTRQTDLAARHVGDMYSVLMINSDYQYFPVIMERLREAAEQLFGGTVTISIGVAIFPIDGTNKDTLFKKAQEALFQAKVNGKNRVCFFEKERITVSDQKLKILAVDNDPKNLKLIEALLLPLNYEVFKASSGEDALSLMERADLDLVLIDNKMPNMDGYELCRHLKGRETTRPVPVLIVMDIGEKEQTIRVVESGADDFITRPLNQVELLARVKSFINVRMISNNLIGIENVLISLATAIEAKEPYTQDHVKRIADLAMTLGRKMGLTEREVKVIRLGAILHDIGMIGMPISILQKPSRLTAEEWELVKSHPETGYNLCLPLEKHLGAALDIIRHHHERLDGSGYPDGLQGEKISLGARLLAVVDTYDALVTDRPYHKSTSMDRALEILRREAEEEKLDARLVKALMEMVADGLHHYNPYPALRVAGLLP